MSKKIEYGTIKKQQDHAFGKDVFLLGIDEDDIKYWLEAPSWDCDWYWGFGYIETYQGNVKPSKARDIDSHQHAETFMKWAIDWNGKEPLLKETTFSNNEAWQLCELFKRFNMFKDMAEYYHRGGAGCTSLNDDKKNLDEWKRINTIEIPYITNKIFEILKAK